MQFIVTVKAKRQIRKATLWYEKERVGLGTSFLDRVTEAFTEIQSAPLRPAIVFRDVRIAMMSRFPYLILYRAKSDDVKILAVIHASRDPDRWETYS